MLNTIPIDSIKLNDKSESIIKKIANETIIDEGIRKIDEKSKIDDAIIMFQDKPEKNQNSQNLDLAKSFHSMESKIFGNIKGGNNKAEKIENFDLSEIMKKFPSEKPIFENNKKIMISMNESLNKFIVNTDTGQQLGYFTLEHIIKYLSDSYDTKKQVLSELDDNIYYKGKALIKSLVFKLLYNKKSNYVSIIIIDYNTSGFMGDIELLVKLNDMLYKYLENDLNNVMSKVDKSNRIKIEKNIKKFVYLLLNYTLKLISLVSEKLKDDDRESKKELKHNLLKYSLSLVYRINTFVQEQLQIFNEQNKSIKELLKYNIEAKEDIKNKLNKLLLHLDEDKKDKEDKNPERTASYSEASNL